MVIGEDELDHVMLWLLCDMSAQQADSLSLSLNKKVSKVSKVENFWKLNFQ